MASKPALPSDPAPASVTPPTPDAPAAVDIAAIVKAAIEASGANNQALAAAIRDGIASSAPRRRISSPADYASKSPFNTPGKSGKKPSLRHDCFQNGFPIPERQVSGAEIDMLHEITPGRYGTLGTFEIVVSEQPSTTGGRKRVYITYPDKTTDDRMRQKTYAPNFHQLLVNLVAEAKAQLAQRKADARAFLADDVA